MDKGNKRQATFSRRAFITGLLQGAGLGVLGARLAWLQISQGERYKILSENNRINVKMLAPSRGQIVDRFGVPLAVNDRNFRVLIVPEQTENLADALDRLAAVIDVPAKRKAKILKEAKKTPSFVSLEVVDNLDWNDVAKVEVNIPSLPGVSIDVGEKRGYPLMDATAHVVGYVGSISKKEMQKDSDPLLSFPGFRIGKTGIEKSQDRILRGKSGSEEIEVNVLGREIRKLKVEPPQAGSRVGLTIDAELQRYTRQRLTEHRSASAVVMNCNTGEIYSLASHPSFDPNIFARGVDTQQWKELVSDPAFPLTNKAVSGRYPPGSTFKMVTALAALKYGVADKRTTVTCTGKYIFGKRKEKFHCWKRGGHGKVDMLSALEQSCDIFFYKLATDIGIERIAKTARELGLGDKYNFGLPEEKGGLIPDKAWKKHKMGKLWMPGETIVASIGQGYMQATPLQLAVMTSRIVNGGYAVNPWIIGEIGDKKLQLANWKKTGFDNSHLEYIKSGMSMVVNGKKGTAKASAIKEKGMEMGGKTGTSQVKRISLKDRENRLKNEDLPWKYRHHALFVGYAPLKNPVYTCCVVVEHGVGGSRAAAPIARDLLYMAQKRDPASGGRGKIL